MKKLNNFHEWKITDKYVKVKEGGKGRGEGGEQWSRLF